MGGGGTHLSVEELAACADETTNGIASTGSPCFHAAVRATGSRISAGLAATGCAVMAAALRGHAPSKTLK
jgi:hypothetical protein